MVDDVVMDSALSSHHEVARNRAVCHVCHTRCGLDHSSGTSSSMAQPVASSSRHPTPSAEPKGLNGSSGTGTSTPTSVKAEGTIFFECLECKRQIASNRYATHLSACMGIGTGRRAANRSNAKTKVHSDAGRSESPYVGSENGTMSDDASPSPAKGKGKSKGKRVDEAEFNLKRKRPGSPQISPINNKSKKQKTSGSPVSRVRANSDAAVASNTYQLPSTGSQSKIPSKLRDSSIASFEPSRSSPSSRSTSPGIASTSTPTSTSAFSAQSPPRPGKKKGRPPKPKPNGNIKALPPKEPSPPRPPPPPIRVPEPDFDVEADETGSSTDTDSP